MWDNFKMRGVGYDTERVLKRIREVAYTRKECPIALIGVGNIGSALLNYSQIQGVWI